MPRTNQEIEEIRLTYLAVPLKATPATGDEYLIRDVADGAVKKTTAGTGGAGEYTQLYGDGFATSFVITHSLDDTEAAVRVQEEATGCSWAVPVKERTADTVTLVHSIPPTSSQFRVTVRR